MKHCKPGFTLLEIMIVVAIIGLLAGLAIPSISRHGYRNKALEALSDARMLQSALIMYRDEVSNLSAYSSADAWGRVQLIVGDNRWETAPLSASALNPSSRPWTIAPPSSINGSVTISKDGSSVNVNQIRKIADLPNF